MRAPRSSLLISVGVVAALLLVACGTDDDAAPATEPSTTATTATTVAPATAPTSPTTTTTTSPPSTTTVVSHGPTLLRYGDDGIVLVAAGTETRIVDGPIAWAASDRAGGVVFTREGDGTDWGRYGITTWWLPAGTTEPRPIERSGVPDTDPDGTPVLVGRGSPWTTGCDVEPLTSPGIRHNLATGKETLILCRDEMGDSWFSITSAGGGRSSLTEGFSLSAWAAALEIVILDRQGNELDLPGNPSGSCTEISHIDGSCDMYGLLSPDGRLIATWYRPDHVATGNCDVDPPESVDVCARWTARLDTVPATIRVLELDTGVELFTTEVTARTRLADFDGRYLVVAPREYTPTTVNADDVNSRWTDVNDAPWTVLDTTGVEEPLTVNGPVALAR